MPTDPNIQLSGCRVSCFPAGSCADYRFVVVFARYREQWLYCRAKTRESFETAGGHIEAGETPMQAARRELWEETGVTDASLRLLFDYHVLLENDSAYGQVFFADVKTLASPPDSFEMAEVRLFDTIPQTMRFPQILPLLYDRVAEIVEEAQSRRELSPMQEFVFTEANAPTPSCHASTLVRSDDGAMVCAWFGGQYESANDVDIWVSRRENGVWSPAIRVSNEPGTPHWNPVLAKRTDGTLVLFYKVSSKIMDWYTMVCESTDHGKTFGTPRELVLGDRTGGRGPVKNKAIVLSDGDWLAPASHEEGELPHSKWRAFFDRSTDEGRTWTRTDYLQAPVTNVWYTKDAPSVQPPGLIQPTLWESEPGKVHALMRSNARHIYRADSNDGGSTWSEAYPIDLPNNNSGLDLAAAADGSLYLCCNPVGESWGERTPLTIFRSTDNGESWNEFCVLEQQPGEYSYPAILVESDRLCVSYTWKRERVAYAEIPLP